MRLRKVKVLVCGLLLSVGMASPAYAIRGCEDPSDRSCCSLIEALKGCRN